MGKPVYADAGNPHGPASIVSMTSIAYRRNGLSILDDVAFSIAAGEVLAILGPNGGGKTTLAKLLTKLITPSAGQVEHRSNLRVGYVPQFIRQDPTLPLSVGSFLAQGQKSRAIKETHELNHSLGLDPLLARPLSALSGGELRRAAIARALGRKPDLLVLDEPTAGLDSSWLATLTKHITNKSEHGKCGIVVISHDLFTFLPIANRVICLDREIKTMGTPREVVYTPAFENMFGKPLTCAAQDVLASAGALEAD